MNFSWIFANRASVIIYNILLTVDREITFLLPANICPIVPVIFLKAKIKFKFVDISLETLCIDLRLVKIELANYDKVGLVYVRNLGIMHDIDEDLIKLKEINPNLLIIDDRCTAKISFDSDQFCSAVDATIFSTGYGKYLDLGFGGLGYINSETIYYRPSTLRYNPESERIVSSLLRNSIAKQLKFSYQYDDWLDTRMIEMEQDDYIELINRENAATESHKREINNIYKSLLPPTLVPDLGFEMNSWRFTLFCDKKEMLLSQIFNNGYFASSHYAPISNLFSNYKAQNCTILYDKTINLFNNSKINEKDAIAISSIIKKALN